MSRKRKSGDYRGQIPAMLFYSAKQYLYHVQARSESPDGAHSYEEYEHTLALPGASHGLYL